MAKYGIVVDNTFNLNKKDIGLMDISIVSLYVNMENKFYKAININKKEYFERIKNINYVPKTSQPSVSDFSIVYEEKLKKYENLIVLTMPKLLSGTFNSATLAAKMINENRIHVFDSNTTSFGLGYLVKELHDLIKNGIDSIEKIGKFIKDFHTNLNIYMNVGNINYLFKGGRIGKAKALMGGFLKLKPLLSLKNGEIIPVKNYRGQKHLIKEMVSKALYQHGKIKKIAIAHTDNILFAKEIFNEIIKFDVPLNEITLDYIDIVIGTHLGPNSVGIIVYYE